jgi:hypothetical protein
VEGLKNIHQGTEKIPIAHVIIIFFPWTMLLFEIYHWNKCCQTIWYIPFIIGFLTFSLWHEYFVEGPNGIHDLIFHWPLFLSNFNISSSIYVTVYTQLHYGPWFWKCIFLWCARRQSFHLLPWQIHFFVEVLNLLHPHTKKIPFLLKSSISTFLVKFGKYDLDLTYYWLKVI